MTTESRERALSLLNAAIEAMDNAGKTSNIAPANAAFLSTSDILTAIRVGPLSIHVGRLLADEYRIQ